MKAVDTNILVYAEMIGMAQHEQARELLRELPALVLLAETDRHAAVLDAVLRESGVTGNLVHDAHVVALCLEHGVAEILTGDRDFRRFTGLTVTDPFAP